MTQAAQDRLKAFPETVSTYFQNLFQGVADAMHQPQHRGPEGQRPHLVLDYAPMEYQGKTVPRFQVEHGGWVTDKETGGVIWGVDKGRHLSADPENMASMAKLDHNLRRISARLEERGQAKEAPFIPVASKLQPLGADVVQFSAAAKPLVPGGGYQTVAPHLEAMFNEPSFKNLKAPFSSMVNDYAEHIASQAGPNGEPSRMMWSYGPYIHPETQETTNRIFLQTTGYNHKTGQWGEEQLHFDPTAPGSVNKFIMQMVRRTPKQENA
jgi:hypothetical protein